MLGQYPCISCTLVYRPQLFTVHHSHTGANSLEEHASTRYENS